MFRASARIGSNPFSIEKGFEYLLDESHCYILPFRISNRLENEWIVEYHYQNSTDKEESISQEDWDERAETWRKLLIENKTARIFRYEAVTARPGVYGDNCIEHMVRDVVDELRTNND